MGVGDHVAGSFSVRRFCQTLAGMGACIFFGIGAAWICWIWRGAFAALIGGWGCMLDYQFLSLGHWPWGHRRIWFGISSSGMGAFALRRFIVVRRHFVGSFGGVFGCLLC